MIRNTKPTLAVAVAATFVFGAVALAASNTEAIKGRQEAMSGVRDAMQGLASIAKKEVPFEAEAVHKHAASIEEHLKEAARLFPEGSGEGDVETWAKPEIWSNYADFTLKLEKGQAAAVALQSVADEAALRPAMGKLGSACKGCHTDYRRPKR